MAERWKLICRLKDLPRPGVRLVTRGLAWQELPGVALFRTADDQLHALLDSCPHHGGPLSRGVLLERQVCCAHDGWKFDLASGQALAPRAARVRKYTVRLDDGRVYLDLEELSAPASKAEAALAGSLGGARVPARG